MPATEDRLELLKSAQPDTWIALSEDESKIVGRGSTYADAVQEATQNGVEDPILIKVPSRWVPHAFLTIADRL